MVLLPYWLIASGMGAHAHLVDLSYPLSDSTPIYPGDPEPHIFTATTVAREGYNLSHVHIGTQTGTHIDAPFHFHDDGASIDRLPLDMMIGRAIVIRVPGKTAGEHITVHDLEPHRPALVPGVIVLFASGWYHHAGSEAFFAHPFLDESVGQVLLAAGVQTIAIDTLNADRTGGDEFPIHEMFAAAGGLIAENLTNTDALTPGVSPLLSLLPLNLVACDGGPVRAVALEPAPRSSEESA